MKQYKLKLIITSLMLVFVFSISIISSFAVPVSTQILQQQVEEIINGFSGNDIDYKIESVVHVKSVS